MKAAQKTFVPFIFAPTIIRKIESTIAWKVRNISRTINKSREKLYRLLTTSAISSAFFHRMFFYGRWIKSYCIDIPQTKSREKNIDNRQSTKPENEKSRGKKKRGKKHWQSTCNGQKKRNKKTYTIDITQHLKK